MSKNLKIAVGAAAIAFISFFAAFAVNAATYSNGANSDLPNWVQQAFAPKGN